MRITGIRASMRRRVGPTGVGGPLRAARPARGLFDSRGQSPSIETVKRLVWGSGPGRSAVPPVLVSPFCSHRSQIVGSRTRDGQALPVLSPLLTRSRTRVHGLQTVLAPPHHMADDVSGQDRHRGVA
jgi:hypothetical protein